MANFISTEKQAEIYRLFREGVSFNDISDMVKVAKPTVCRWVAEFRELKCPSCGSSEAWFIQTRNLWKCSSCLRQYSSKIGTLAQGSRLSEEQWAQCKEMYESGFSTYKIAIAIGVSQSTSYEMVNRIRNQSEVAQPVEAGPLECDYCGEPLDPDKDGLRRLGKRLNHKFCNTECYGLYRSSQTIDDCCKRCGKRRRSGPGSWFFTRGYCTRCYGLLREFNWDESAVDVHDLNIKLKETIRGNRKHGGPTPNAR